MRERNVFLASFLALVFVTFSACDKLPTQPSRSWSIINTNYENISIIPSTQHLKIGDKVEFIAMGGDGIYQFSTYAPTRFAINGAVNCACMFNAIYNGNRASLTLVDPSCTGWKISEVELNVSSPNNNGWPNKALIVID